MFLIDGYNLLHAYARGRATGSAREELIARLADWCREGGYSARIVFDPTAGLKRRDLRGPVEVCAVAQGRTADDEILALLAATEDRTAYTLVTNDLALVRAAEKKGMKVLASEDVAKLLSGGGGVSSPDKPDSISPGEVDHWMKEFGFDDPKC